ncbi:hypothetical protein J18TS1_25480 [Oceanobacillus oncorhynchi subsp. incaldanensis]|nr:hypothetical protein J18TS1_25480 [Oceanobacillus oncorhynchi subsp. incaldanensis]
MILERKSVRNMALRKPVVLLSSQNVNKSTLANPSTTYGWGILLYMQCFKNRGKFTRSIHITYK